MNTLIQNHVKDGGTEIQSHPILYTVIQAAYLLGIKTTTMYALINKKTIRVCKVWAESLETSVVFPNSKNADQKEMYKCCFLQLAQRIEKV
jgi:hypothetical protein